MVNLGNSNSKDSVITKQKKVMHLKPLKSTLYETAHLRAIIEDFVLSLEAKIDDLQRHLQEEMFQDLTRIAHGYKGSAAIYGFSEISELMGQIESEAKLGVPSKEGISENIEKLKLLSLRAKLALDDL